MFNSYPSRHQKVSLIACPLVSQWNIPLALPSLAAFLQQFGYDTKCWDLNLDFLNTLWTGGLPRTLLDMKIWRRLEVNDSQLESNLSETVTCWGEMILRDQPTVIGMSITLVTVRASLMLAKAIKLLNPHIVIVFDGPECTLNWYKLILHDAIDFIVIGEGEQPLRAALQRTGGGVVEFFP
jgi:hypothetical protein